MNQYLYQIIRCSLITWGLLSASLSFAHDVTGALGATPDAKDIYYVNCGSEAGDITTKLSAAIIDWSPVKPPRLLVRIWRTNVAVATIDPVDGDNNYGVFANRRGGAKVYGVSVSKLPQKLGASDATRNYAETYNLQYHCVTGTEHTDTDIAVVQNQ